MNSEETRPRVMSPSVTGNAVLLLGYIAGLMATRDDYSVVDVAAADGDCTIEHRITGNVYRLRVEQTGGVE